VPNNDASQTETEEFYSELENVVKLQKKYLLLLLLVFCCNNRSMTPITWQAAVDDEEQWPLVQDILKAAVDVHHV